MPGPADISVIVCTRNRPEHLRRALAAIRDVTPSETEVIVVDSASDTSETREVAEQFGVVYVRSGKGLSVARNVGITTSQRPFVIFTDDDCLPTPQWIEQVLPHFEDPSVGVVTGWMMHHTDTADDAVYHRRPLYRTPIEGLDAGHGAVMAFRRPLLLRIGGFDDVMGAGQRWAGAEDLDIFVRILRAGSIIVHEKKCVVTHANDREGEEYVSLYRGYGLGLGALVAKWLRVDPAFGTQLAWRLAGRSAARIARAEIRHRPSSHERAMLGGIVTGAREARRLPLVGERFVPPWSKGPMPTLRDAEPAAVSSSGVPVAPTASVELLRILDETHVATSIQFEAMHTRAVLVLEGDPLLDADGRIDREKVLEAMRRIVERVPELTLRVMRSPLGLTAPAWVPATDFDVRDHVFFHDEPSELRGDLLTWLSAGDRGLLPMDRPLWDITFTPLTTGEVALGVRLHHANGDAKWLFNMFTTLTDRTADGYEPATSTPSDRPARRAPRTRAMIPVHAARSWLREQPTVEAAWREYWRKPFVKRAKRMVGRNIRPFKELLIERRGLRATFLPPAADAFFVVDVPTTKRRASALGGTLSDLLVAASVRSVDDDRDGIDVIVPVSHRKRGDEAIRNHISLVRVHTVPSSGLAEVVSSVRTQVAAHVRGESVEDQPSGRSIGYVTVVPWARESRSFAGARIVTPIVLPAADRRDELSAFATVYGDKMIVSTTTRAELDTEGMTHRLRAILEGADE
ncbi:MULTISPECIES: glycosyltransferase [Microbacterium]|uniref:glycosyltransferase n=1 Tax=Microbacterium TaxID=33882 RepID=UPI002785F2FB|nr:MULTISPECIES: glycosyltransferase [Microbacterium]MDQ1084624.1 hypothetical protein [Microbacterium sp. SORGH_AS_0344]MDQ1170099.1 hypothetical protein [Microbacterium proteolyticum]